MWDLPGPGLEPLSPALAGGFLTTAPPGKPRKSYNPDEYVWICELPKCKNLYIWTFGEFCPVDNRTNNMMFWYSLYCFKFSDALERLVRLNSRSYSWIRFITAMNTEPKQQGKKCCLGGIQLSKEGLLSLSSSKTTQDVLSLWQRTVMTPVQSLCPGKTAQVSGCEAFMGCWSHRHILLLNQLWKLKHRTPTVKTGTPYQPWCLFKATWQAGTGWSITPDENKSINH